MKLYPPFNVSVPILIIIWCIATGMYHGAKLSNNAIATNPQHIEDPAQLRASLKSRCVTGNLLRGAPFALVLFFALMPFNRKHHK